MPDLAAFRQQFYRVDERRDVPTPPLVVELAEAGRRVRVVLGRRAVLQLQSASDL